jgi:hypothetical protein
MKLSEALTKRIQLQCTRCTALQPAYVHLMIEKLGPDALLKDALKTASCFFCKGKGELLILHVGT